MQSVQYGPVVSDPFRKKSDVLTTFVLGNLIPEVKKAKSLHKSSSRPGQTTFRKREVSRQTHRATEAAARVANGQLKSERKQKTLCFPKQANRMSFPAAAVVMRRGPDAREYGGRKWSQRLTAKIARHALFASKVSFARREDIYLHWSPEVVFAYDVIE